MKNKFLIILILFSFIGLAQKWESSYENVKIRATDENKNIVLVFSGSDWCAPCIKLDKVVWQSEEFKIESEKKWVLYKADFPKKKANQLSPEKSTENKKLAEKYNPNGNFPLVVLMDKNGKVIGMTGYKNVSAAEYINLLNSLEK